MDYVIYPGKLQGRITAPPSKSEWHRQLILEMLSGGNPELPADAPLDCVYTKEGLTTILSEKEGIVNCHDSGATLRFLLPIAAVRNPSVRFTGSDRLLQRPLPFPVRKEGRELAIVRPLHAGEYRMDGSLTSQVISGLLMALSLEQESSTITVTGGAVSAPYIAMTCHFLKLHGIDILKEDNAYRVLGGQKLHTEYVKIGGDYSSVSCLLACNQGLSIENLQQPSCQGDVAILTYCTSLPETVDVSATPDLVPALVVLATARQQRLRITGAKALQEKESRRLTTIADTYRQLGGTIRETEDSLEIEPSTLKGGVEVPGCDDHRIVMMASVLGTLCEKKIVVKDGECVRKSYPAFFNDLKKLSVRVEERNV